MLLNGTPSQALPARYGLVYGIPAYNLPGPVGYIPPVILQYYGISNGTAPDAGAGQTIAIVAPYDYPTANLTADITLFDTDFGIEAFGGAGGPTLTKYAQDGTFNYPSVDPEGPMAVTGDMTWEEVEAMDVEWAHAAAPGANIVLVEANDNTIGNIMTAVNTARNMSGVSVVVVACAFNEGAVGASLEQTYDSIFTTPSGHTPVTFVAGTGDLYPQTVTYPAVSPNVISVGGTAFEFDSSGDFLGEVPWADDQEFTVQDTYTLVGGDGGTSTVENRPAYQNSVQATGGKDAPDVSFLADPDYVDNYDSPVGGVCVCDSYDNNGSAAEGYGPWEVDGGTNLGAACWAGLIADVDAERVTEGLPALDGPTQALPDLYAIHNYGQTVSSGSPFFDVFNVIATTSTGYDTETGLGTPGLNLIPALAGAPGVTVAAAAAGDTATTALLSVQGEDLDFGSQNLAYTWVCTSKPSTAATPTFSVNDSIAAEETVATFYEAGTYTFTVAMTDAEGMSAYSSTTAVISQVATEVTVSPSPATIVSGHTQQFAVTGIDQFGNSMTPTVTWGTTGGVGTISSSGLLTASYAAETGTVTATATSAFGNAFGSANVTVTNTPPVINSVTGSPSPVTGTQAVLSCVATDDGGPANLSYTWLATMVPVGAATPGYSVNSSNAASTTTVTFHKAGNYTFRITVLDMGGLSAVSTVNVTVDQTLSSVGVSPSPAGLYLNEVQQFTAAVDDQFGVPMPTQPSSFAWSATIGSIGATTGLFQAPGAHAIGTVSAKTGNITGTASVVVNAVPPQVTTAAAANPNPVTGKTTSLSVSGWDDLGPAALIYTWAATTLPAGAVAPTFSVNGTNLSNNTTATFSHAGTYNLTVTLRDTLGLSTTSSVSVVVNATLTTIVVSPSPLDMLEGTQQQFAATGKDQFNNPLATQPNFAWVSLIGGTMSGTGLFTAPMAIAKGNITASSGGVTGTATISCGPTLITSITVPPATAVGQSLEYYGAFTYLGSTTCTAVWSWGDGTTTPATVTQASGAGTCTASHAYATKGAYTVTLTLTSPGYVISATKTVTVAAQGSALLAPDPLNPAKTALYVYGTNGNDVILVGVNSAGQVQVAINYFLVGTYAPTGHIIVYGLGGSDTIAVSSLITLPAWLFGGSVKDTIYAGGGPTLMVGGSGTNTFYHGAGRYLIVPHPSSIETNSQTLDSLMAQWEAGGTVVIPP